jgi:tRNA pseudouridine38-40 synthase
MVVAYDGALFHGFARQPEQPQLPTIQGVIEEALTRFLGEEIRTSGAGRTDAGVHALGQVISFSRAAAVDDLNALRKSLNSMCGPAIAILEIAEASDVFDARFSAVSRTYEYGILRRDVHDPFSRHTTWHQPQPLDLPAIKEAAQAVMGEHDFSSFGRVEEGKNPVRRIEVLEVEEQGDLLLVRMTANSFIQQMVRSIVGTLVKVGSGKIPAASMNEILHSRDRSKAGPVAPAHGLFLVSVAYPEEFV